MDYTSGVRSILAGLLVLALALATAGARADEHVQNVVPLEPQQEQHIEALQPGGVEGVEPVAPVGEQDVSSVVIPTERQKLASKIGKGVVAGLGAAVGLASAVALLVFI